MWPKPNYYKVYGVYYGTPKAFGMDLLKRKAALRGGWKRK